MRIFISAVTSEFGKARDAIRSDLAARGHTVRVQSDFQQSADSDTLLERLAEYIRDCHAVICVIGKRSGACPPSPATERISQVPPNGISEASYTQWEVLFARYYKRRTYTYLAGDNYKPDRDAAKDDRADLQSACLAFFKANGVHYHTIFER